MGRKQRATADLTVEMLNHGLGKREAVIGTSSTSDLIEDDQTVRGGTVENPGSLSHLHQKRTRPAGKIITGTDAM